MSSGQKTSRAHADNRDEHSWSWSRSDFVQAQTPAEKPAQPNGKRPPFVPNLEPEDFFRHYASPDLRDDPESAYFAKIIATGADKLFSDFHEGIVDDKDLLQLLYDYFFMQFKSGVKHARYRLRSLLRLKFWNQLVVRFVAQYGKQIEEGYAAIGIKVAPNFSEMSRGDVMKNVGGLIFHQQRNPQAKHPASYLKAQKLLQGLHDLDSDVLPNSWLPQT